ncbi:MAG: Fe-S cluster assembly protein SufD [Chloroflexota bacterium]
MPLTREAVEEISSQRSEPTWLREERLRAWQAFEDLPMPDSGRDEDWRRTDVSALDLSSYVPATNGSAAAELAIPPELPRGVIFCSLDQAVRDYPELVREHLVEAETKFSTLNKALWTGGSFVYVPPDTRLETHLQATHGIAAPSQAGGRGALVTPRTLIVVDRGASLIYVDRFTGGPEDAASSAVTDVLVKEGARLEYVSLQERGERTWHFSSQRVAADRDARVDVVVVALGGFISKSYVDTLLLGPGTEANIVGLVLTDGVQHVDHQTLQEHRAPHTTSNLLLKSAVKGHSQSVFAGLVRMPREAQQSDAFQEARALLLSEHAKADAIPKLEIVANDVRCTHAGAIGQIDPEQKFYLQSRGISELEAERLIVGGFFEPALDRIPVEDIRERLRGALDRRLESVHG